MKFLFWGFKSSREFLENSLGTLERDVMTLAWERAEISVREACERLGSSVAYTTVMTTMDRLFKKGLLDRRKVGRAFVYRARATRQQLENAVLSSLVDAVSERDRALLDELERLVREKRRELGTKT
jgi:predicted transcriptional regulator